MADGIDFESKAGRLLWEIGLMVPELEEVAAMMERGSCIPPEMTMKEQSQLGAMMALELYVARMRSAARGPNIECLRMLESVESTARTKLFARQYNAALMRIWNEEHAMHPEHRWTDAEQVTIASRALAITRAAMGRPR